MGHAKRYITSYFLKNAADIVYAISVHLGVIHSTLCRLDLFDALLCSIQLHFPAYQLVTSVDVVVQWKEL